MSYTAFAQMRAVNVRRFGKDLGPMEPDLYRNPSSPEDLKSAALRFLHNRCEGLRFDAQKAAQDTAAEAVNGRYQGTSLSPGQIPYNMQMDVDRLCLERELEAFIDSGTAEDAYTVYYSYLEMFLGEYGKSQQMIELLSEFESNASSLLMKHRDHYSHSVYVFALGLAIYETNTAFRHTFMRFYGFDPDQTGEDARAAAFFLKFWGLTALFHDIGYPFEIPFEQIISYFEVDGRKRGKGGFPYLAYQNILPAMKLGTGEQAHFQSLYHRTFTTTGELFAYDITAKLGEAYGMSEGYLVRQIERKPTHPDEFNYFMDHAFFSSLRLYQELVEEIGIDGITPAHVDALTAILLHNSLFKFSVSNFAQKDPALQKPPLVPALHPLAFLLMVCDELQCWDRTAYGRNSRTELHPWNAVFDFQGGAINATYEFDSNEWEKMEDYAVRYQAWKADPEKNARPTLKAFSNMQIDDVTGRQPFADDIRRIVDLTDMPLTVSVRTSDARARKKHTYLSNSSFLHLYDFAVAMNARYENIDTKTDGDDTELRKELESKFNQLSLEYKLSNINQVKSFNRYLNEIHCFYTDKAVGYDLLDTFSPWHTAAIAPLEHQRWVRFHLALGWRYGTDYETADLNALSLLPADGSRTEKEVRKALREQTRCHKLCMDGVLYPPKKWNPETRKEEDVLVPDDAAITAHYNSLPEEEQDKDWKPFNKMLELLKLYDGLRIYELDV